MLAPLENRAILEREPATAEDIRHASLLAENTALRQSLRQARSNQKRLQTRHASQMAEQAERLSVLESERHNLLERIEQLESGQAIIELGRQLMEAREANQQLMAAAQRVWHLDKTLCAAHRECERLARERDQLALLLCEPGRDNAD